MSSDAQLTSGPAVAAPSAAITHTAGPWGAYVVGDGDIRIDSRSYVVATVWGGMSGVEHEANARLIASAPELLALAHSLKRWLMADAEPSHIGSDDMRVYHLDGGVLSNLLNEARATLAKAEPPTPEPDNAV